MPSGTLLPAPWYKGRDYPTVCGQSLVVWFMPELFRTVLMGNLGMLFGYLDPGVSKNSPGPGMAASPLPRRNLQDPEGGCRTCTGRSPGSRRTSGRLYNKYGYGQQNVYQPGEADPAAWN